MSSTRGGAGIIWRLLGFALALLYLLVGGLALFVLGIAGLWAGFAESRFVLMFSGLLLYFFGTAALALRFGLKPSRNLGLVLAGLVLPGLLYVVLSGDSQHEDLRTAARAWVSDDDLESVQNAHQTLLTHGRRAGRQGHVEILLNGLADADSDQQRERLVCMLGELSYQYEPVLHTLRELLQETAGSLEREDLHRATVLALHGVNPYEDLERAQGASVMRRRFEDVCGHEL